MILKNKHALYIALITVMFSCSNKKVSYEQKIEAPLVGSALAFDLYAYKQDTSIRIATPKGTVIEIEPNTFAHANGSRVSNQIIIKVREMHTANDIFKSGIPMSVDAGRNDFLQSGGMLEIRAFDNNEELVIANGKSINVALAHFKPSNGYSLYHFNEHQNWQVNDTFVVQKNERKRRGLDKIIRFLKNPIKQNGRVSNNEFEIVANVKESPHLRAFQNQKWRIVDGSNPKMVQTAMRMSWDDVVVKPVNLIQKIYRLTFTRALTVQGSGEQNKSLTVQASPVNVSDTAFAKQLINYEETIVKMNNEKLRLEAEADMVSSFRIRQMGIWNIDKIMNKEDLVTVSVKFDFEKEVDPFVNHIKLFVLHEDDNSVIYYLPQDWKNVKLSKVKRNSLIAVLPGNRVAIVDANTVKSKMQIGGSVINFTTKIDYSTNVLVSK
jgi:hypothetical protein